MRAPQSYAKVLIETFQLLAKRTRPRAARAPFLVRRLHLACYRQYTFAAQTRHNIYSRRRAINFIDKGGRLRLDT